MNNVIVRSLSGIVYVALLVGAVLYGDVALVVLLSLFSVIGVYEFINMSRDGKFPRMSTLTDMACGVALIISLWMLTSGHPEGAKHWGVAILCLLIARLIGQLYSHNSNSTNALGHSITSIIYISLPLALVAVLYNTLAGAHLVLAILIFIWVNDTGAFCVGSLIGKHKLFERISPKKTWEGFFGGMIFCVVAALLMNLCFTDYFAGLTTLQMCILGVVVSIFATFGDLIESQIKRTAGVKDSSHLIPGHGGILDRIDSLLLVVPVTVVYFAII